MKNNKINLNGIIVINKSKNITSNKALQQLKHLYNAQKAGHTGTLDPMATGVLPICFGKATKISQYLLDADKEYIATIKLGIETDSGDAKGNVIKKNLNIPKLDKTMLEVVLDHFRGEISQAPPMYSALKHNGQRLYKLAREGIQIKIKSRNIIIHALELLGHNNDELIIKVRSSKGTYIRSLGMDIGHKLGCGGHLIALQRTKSGPFSLEESYSFEELKDLSFKDKLATISHVESIFLDKSSYILAEKEKEDLYKKGIFPFKKELNGTIKLYDKEKFIAIAEFDKGILIDKKFFDQEILKSE